MSDWTGLADVRSRLARRWEGGRLLRDWAGGADFLPISVPLAGPGPADLVERFDDVRRWRSRWLDDAAATSSFTLRTRTVGSRSIGANTLPSHLDIASWEDLFSLLKVERAVRTFARLRGETAAAFPELESWATSHPRTVLDGAAAWPRLLATLAWLREHRGSGLYLRQVPIPGVDTKFIEAHRALLCELLECLVSPVDGDAGRRNLARRFGYATPPPLIRFRLLSEPGQPLTGLSEVAVRAEEFDAVAPPVGTVFIVENEVTYLAFPQQEDAALIFGSGYALSAIAAHTWFAGRRVVYWGDLDTHGMAILSRLRMLQPHTASMLMDRATLLAHPDQWVTEDRPTRERLEHLTPAEQQLYQELVEDALGSSVRLEQERISYPLLQAAMRLLQP